MHLIYQSRLKSPRKAKVTQKDFKNTWKRLGKTWKRTLKKFGIGLEKSWKRL